MARRKSTGKRLRFEVFKRDHFTCQYCGAQPPDVVLVVDHITPVCQGGDTTLENLVTACEACNQGKAGKPLSNVPIRPDADLLYLETQQEIAEIRRYRQAIDKRLVELNATVKTLQTLWCEMTGGRWYPGERILNPFVMRFPIDIATDALINVAAKVASGYVNTYDTRWVAYLNKVAQNIMEESE
jgi:hypothetical protein